VHIVLMRASPAEALAALAGQGARLLLPGEVVAWADLPPAACLVMALALAPPEP
jgi:hypothetical protein